MSKTNMGGDSLSEEGIFPPCPIKKLVGEDDIPGLYVILEGPDTICGYDPCDAECFKSIDVGPVVDIRRRKGMPLAMTCEKGHSFSLQLTDDVGI